jgi:hypothetical protein
MSNNGNNAVSVVHLVWIDFGIDLFKRFLESYKKYPAGYPHDLVLLFNGVSDDKEIQPYLDLVLQIGLKFQSHVNYKRDQDLTAYFWVAERIATPYILFLNSYAELLQADWLAKYMHQASNPEVGIVGASGSWLSYYRTVLNRNSWHWERSKSFAQNIKKYRTLSKAVFYWKWLFPDFPNPHIRTNAFLISRDLMLQVETKSMESKFSAYLLESGNKSITRQILAKGKRVLVIDRQGVAFEPEDWDKAKVFWISTQENLLVSDNQTAIYDQLDSNGKKEFTFNAWGIR